MATSPSGACTHLAAALSDPTRGPKFRKLVKATAAWSARHGEDGRPLAKRRKIAAPECNHCKLTLRKPFVCLECSYTACWLSGHITKHLTDSGHMFCVEAHSGSVYCAKCSNFVYDASMENLHFSTTLAEEERKTKFNMGNRRRDAYKPWIPEADDSLALADAIKLPCQDRRGLINLGQTCFMNAVLQSFLHNPLLRNHFLSDAHNSKLCSKTKEGKECMCCELDRLFCEVFAPSTAGPYGPTSLLYATWRLTTSSNPSSSSFSSDLAGYAQQDAHEFLISSLNQLHADSRGRTNVSCNCIIHNTFSGELRSDLICETGGHVRSMVETMFDLSLDLAGNGGKGKDDTLTECLRRYTRPEKMVSTCEDCGAKDINKRMSIHRLPPILSFQFKRFEQHAEKSTARKIDTPVRFPSSINMAPYTTTAVSASTTKARPHAPSEKGAMLPPPPPNTLNPPGPESIYMYDLFAVINHEGQMDNGHYTSFARSGNEWYRFDDDKVTPTTLSACLSSSAYMCFYVKRHLDYMPHARPSYVVTREIEAKREEEREREKEAARNKEVEDALLASVE